MPNIPYERRGLYQELLDIIENEYIVSAADLSFLICTLMKQFIKGTSGRWDSLADALKALAAAEREFEVEVYDPYEAKVREKNGGVF